MEESKRERRKKQPRSEVPEEVLECSQGSRAICRCCGHLLVSCLEFFR